MRKIIILAIILAFIVSISEAADTTRLKPNKIKYNAVNKTADAAVTSTYDDDYQYNYIYTSTGATKPITLSWAPSRTGAKIEILATTQVINLTCTTAPNRCYPLAAAYGARVGTNTWVEAICIGTGSIVINEITGTRHWKGTSPNSFKSSW